VFKLGLELHGYSVDTFTDPERALSDFKPRYYGISVIDVRMPGMSGFELAREIWLQDAIAKICLMTAFEIYEDEARKVFKDFKMHCYLKKPMTPTALAEHIKKHL
jgi:DNA-binding response OmpR family regulator